LRKRAVLGLSDPTRLRPHDRPGGFYTGLGIRPPMDEHPELGIAIPGCLVIRDRVCPTQPGNRRQAGAGQGKLDEFPSVRKLSADIRRHISARTKRVSRAEALTDEGNALDLILGRTRR
jgi:hypothetical protein